MTTTPALNDDLVREIEAAEWWERGDTEGDTVVSVAPERLAEAYRTRAKEIEALRAALRPFSDVATGYTSGQEEDHIVASSSPSRGVWFKITIGDLRRARTALTGA